MSNITIKTLAKELNVSVATVSKAMKDSHEIGAATKQRVIALAQKLNYTPNPYASSLRHKKSKTIAIVLPEVADSFFSVAINGIEAAAQDKGYHVLIYLTHENFAKEQEILKDFQNGRVDGVLMSITSETTVNTHVQELYATGMPLVFFDRVCGEVDTACIVTDDFASGYKATAHLVERGCKKIALLSISESLAISNNRMEGYKKALLDSGRMFNEADVILCSNNNEKSYAVIKALLNTPGRPDGILATVEKFTTNIYLACRELSLSIPGDVKVVGFANLATAPILNPSLTTVTQPAFEMGKVAATMLIGSLDKRNYTLKKEHIIIPSELIVRDSSGGG